ncbi:MAG: DUF1566 domain-containing protein [Campylobacterales bacterium]|nr:DUF1566 domain-containing protein [Campylobacterales bacterium]
MLLKAKNLFSARALYALLFFYTLLSAEVLVDPKTYLMWQDSPENKGTLHTWNEAKEYCESLNEGKFSDWWLPSEQELSSIVDTSRSKGRMIQKGFIYFKPRHYWTSTTYAWNAPHAWAISFQNGLSVAVEKEQQLHTRCVRCSDFKRCLECFYNK